MIRAGSWVAVSGRNNHPSVLGGKGGEMVLAIRKQTLSSHVSNEVRLAILSGEIAPGEKINLDNLRKKYGISISPAREAVARLVGTGLVEFADQRGYRSTTLSTAELEDIVALRITIETMALRESIAHATLDWESKVMGALHRLKRNAPPLAGGGVSKEWIAAYADFHLALGPGAGNPLLRACCLNLIERFSRYCNTTAGGAAPLHALGGEHDEIAKYAIARDGEKACGALAKHIQSVGACLLALFEVN